MGDVGKAMCGGAGGTWETSVLSTACCCECKTALKIKSIRKVYMYVLCVCVHKFFLKSSII